MSHVRLKCRLEAENKAKKEAELRAIAKLEKDREERGAADELAGAMNEFFTALYVDDMAAGYDDYITSANGGYGSSSMSEMPLASPDSITVTTEFGVLEESGTVTIISANGPSPHHAAYDNDTEEENNVEMTEDLHDEMSVEHGSGSGASNSLAPVASPLSTTTALQVNAIDPSIEHMQDLSDDDDMNDTGEEGDVDTDDFDVDAESAIIEEFLDDNDDTLGDNDHEGGLLTPVATASA